jgi:hypothetical protein
MCFSKGQTGFHKPKSPPLPQWICPLWSNLPSSSRRQEASSCTLEEALSSPFLLLTLGFHYSRKAQLQCREARGGGKRMQSSKCICRSRLLGFPQTWAQLRAPELHGAAAGRGEEQNKIKLLPRPDED